MGMGGGDQNPVTWYSRPLGGKGLGFVEHRSWHHATVHHHDGNFRLAVRQHEGLGVDWVGHSGGVSTGHATVDQHGELFGAYVKGDCSRPKLGIGEMCETECEDEE